MHIDTVFIETEEGFQTFYILWLSYGATISLENSTDIVRLESKILSWKTSTQKD